jgi:hypothetical protein
MTDRTNKNNMPLIFDFGAIKNNRGSRFAEGEADMYFSFSKAISAEHMQPFTGVTKYFDLPWGHFSKLNIETIGVEIRPWPIEN